MKRRPLATAVLTAGLGLASFPALGQAQTPRELYEAALEQVATGDTEAALTQLRQIDPLQLPDNVRSDYYDLLTRLDPNAPATDAPAASSQPVADRLAAAADASPEEAAAIYSDVLDSADATEAEKATASARVAQVMRGQNPDLASARATIDEATADIQAGNYAAAKVKLESVRDSGLDLGYYEEQRIATRLRVIDQRMAVAETGSSTTGTTQQAALSEAQQARFDSLVSDADAAAEAGELDRALALYADALLIQDDEAVQSRLDEVNASLAEAASRGTAAPAEPSELDSFLEDLEIQKQAVLVRYDENLAASQRAANEGEYPAARDFANRAITELDNGRSLLSTAEYTSLRGSAATRLENIALREQNDADAAARDTARERERELAGERVRSERAKREEVNALLNRAVELQRQGDYDQARARVDEALFVDPNNAAAQLLEDVLRQDQILLNARDFENERTYQIAENSVANIEATIPYSDIVTYPDNWPQITTQRLEGLDDSGGESAANRAAQRLLEDTVIATVNFEGNRLVNVINFLANNTGANFFPNWNALEFAGVGQDTPITLNMNNVTAAQVLDFALKQASNDFDPIGYSVQDGVVVISTETALATTTDVRIYDIRDLLLPIYDNFSNAPEFDLSEALSDNTGGGGGGGGGGGIFGNDTQGQQGQQEQVRGQLVGDIISLIQDTVGDPFEWVNNGGDVSSVYELRGRLVIRSTGNNHGAIRKLLTDFREFRSIAISVEARILLVDESFLEEISVDLDVQWNDPGGNFGPISFAQDSISLAQRGVNSTPSTPEQFRLSTQAAGPQVIFEPPVGITDGTSAGIGGNTSGRGIDFGLSYLDDLQVNLLVQATQGNRRSISLTAPRVTFLNGTSAVVTVATQLAFVSDLTVVPDAAAFDPDIDVVNSGVVLAVEGAVSADRRYVTMNIWPSLSVVDAIRSIRFAAVATTGDGDGAVPVPIEGVIEAPEVSITQVRTQVSVPDRGTLMLGGQRLVGEIEIEAGVPVLSKIPFIKRFFTNNSTVKDERTLLILVRPTILLQSEEEERNFPGLTEDPTNYPTR